MNGNTLVNYAIYKCDKCGRELPEKFPRCDDGDINYCFECSLRQGLISEKCYMDSGSGLDSSMFHIGFNPETGVMTIWDIKKVAPWKRNPKQDRNSKEYTDWRTSVFKRDDYTCQDCNQHGGNLNAHHIKLFSKFKSLRYKVSNGTTLCETCHRKRHKRGNVHV